MSNRCCRNLAPVAAAVLLCASWAGSFAAGMKPPRKVREAVGTTRADYIINRQGEEVGSESIVRTDYNNNSVSFTVHNQLNPSKDTHMDEKVEFTVVEESFYPLKYEMTKDIKQGDSGISMQSSIEMFANVAVMTTKSAEAEGTRRVVLPTGTGFVETGTIYSYEQFLFWYDRDLGGRQSFNAVDVSNGKEETIIVNLIAQDTLRVQGMDTSVDVYKVQRKAFDVTLYVDPNSRVVQVEQNFMTWKLIDWSRDKAKHE